MIRGLLVGRLTKVAAAVTMTAMIATTGWMPSAAEEGSSAARGRMTDGVLNWAAQNGRLRTFMQALPKGGDLHTHLRGAVYAESWIEWAAKDGLCADMEARALRFRASESEQCADRGWITAAEAQANEEHRRSLINSLSNRSYVPTLDWSGHADFFATFDKIAAVPTRLGDQLAEVAARAGAQNILYLELMETIVLPELFPLLSDVKLSGDLADDYQAVMASAFGQILPGLVEHVRTQIHKAMEKKDRMLRCGTAEASAGCDVTIRFQHQVIREMEPALVYGQFILGWALMEQEPMVLGMNLVAPEDGHIALRDYTLHMRMIDHLYNTLGPRNIALHAGELTLGLVRPKQLTFHIREAIELGHAKRIGHGIDIMYEDGAEELLTHMAQDKIMVEINLTSNDTILGVSGADHPLVVYRDREVPYAISTDDEGVSRIDLTHEYMRLFNEHGVPYFEIKHASRNSLTYSFLPGASLWTSEACKKNLDHGTPAGAECAEFLDGSEKARLQWTLEERFRQFETEQRIPTRKRTSFN